MGTRENKFQSSENLNVQTQAPFNHPFHFTSTFKFFIRSSTFVFDVWCCGKLNFMWRYIKQSYRSLQDDVNNLGTRFLSTFTRTSGGLHLNSQTVQFVRGFCRALSPFPRRSVTQQLYVSGYVQCVKLLLWNSWRSKWPNHHACLFYFLQIFLGKPVNSPLLA